MRYQHEFLFDSGRSIIVIAESRGEAIQLLSDTFSIPKDFITKHCKIARVGVFACATKEVRPERGA